MLNVVKSRLVSGKKLVWLAFAGAVIISGCHNNGNNTQANPGCYVINGTITNKDSGWVYFGHYDTTGAFAQDSTRLKAHTFTLTGKVAEPSLFYLWASNTDDSKPLIFFIEDTIIQVTAIKDSMDKATVTGSHTQVAYESYKSLIAPIKMKQQALYKKYDEAYAIKDKVIMDSLEKVADQIDKEEYNTTASYAETNPNSIVGAWAVTKKNLFDPDPVLLKKIYTAFTPAVQQSRYGRQIKKAADIAEHTAKGQPAPDFTMNDSTGKAVSLSSFKGKYLLLDFWASWCGPCRRENPNVVASYTKYKGKNFTILGVSLDDQRAPWLKAIADDHLAWNHVSDLKGWKNAAADQYGVKSIPSNFLISPDGKIIAHNLRGEELEKMLAETLK